MFYTEGKVVILVKNFKGQKRVTFKIEDMPGKTSVVGDFNNWTPGENMLKRKNGGKQTSVVLEPGTYHFRYLNDQTGWLTDQSVEAWDVNNVLEV